MMPVPSSALLAALCLVLLSACSGSGRIDAKLDAPLRARLDATATADSAPIACLIGLSADAPADARAQLEADGLTIGTVAGSVVTASGDAAAIRTAARHDWVLNIELSQERPPLSPS